MKRWFSVLRLKRLRRSKQTTLTRPDFAPAGESMSELQSNDHNTEGFERGEVSVHSNVSQRANIILNHDFSEGLHSWHANCCHAYVASGVSNHWIGAVAHSGETYSVVTNRTECWQGLEQDITGRVSIGMKYDVSAFVHVHGNLDGFYEAQAID